MLRANRVMMAALIVGLVVCFAGEAAQADTLTLNSVQFTGNYGNLSGTGNGPVEGVLSLDQHGNDTFEYGWSGWDGTQETWSDSTSQKGKGTSSSGYYARSVSSLNSYGINKTDFALVFQVNTQGTSDLMQIRTFDLVFYNADGSEAFRLRYVPDYHNLSGTTIAGLASDIAQTTDNGLLPGVGQGTSGWLYTIDTSGWDSTMLTNWNTFWANPTTNNNHIGMQVYKYDNYSDTASASSNYNFDPSNDGPDNFWLTSTGAPPLHLVPLPSADWMGLGLLCLLGLLRFRRRSAIR